MQQRQQPIFRNFLFQIKSNVSIWFSQPTKQNAVPCRMPMSSRGKSQPGNAFSLLGNGKEHVFMASPLDKSEHRQARSMALLSFLWAEI